MDVSEDLGQADHFFPGRDVLMQQLPHHFSNDSTRLPFSNFKIPKIIQLFWALVVVISILAILVLVSS